MEPAPKPEWVRPFVPHLMLLPLLLAAFVGVDDKGFYSMVRWVACANFALLAWHAHDSVDDRWAWIWGVLAGIFNPIVPVNASRELWQLVDLLAWVLVAFDLFIRHESLRRFRKSALRFGMWLGEFVLRLLGAALFLVVMFFIIDFAVNRWG